MDTTRAIYDDEVVLPPKTTEIMIPAFFCESEAVKNPIFVAESTQNQELGIPHIISPHTPKPKNI